MDFPTITMSVFFAGTGALLGCVVPLIIVIWLDEVRFADIVPMTWRTHATHVTFLVLWLGLMASFPVLFSAWSWPLVISVLYVVGALIGMGAMSVYQRRVWLARN